MYYVLLYDYVDDIERLRAAHRADHLSVLNEYHARGEVVLAGAWTDPLDGAAIVFNTDSREKVEKFAESDPYVRNGLVPNWRIREWNVVVGA